MKINVETNSRQMRTVLNDLANQNMRQASSSALNATRTYVLKSVRVDMERSLNVPSSYKKQFRKRFINRRGRSSARRLVTSGWIGTFKVSHKNLNRKSRESFEATMPSGHKGQFRRVKGSQITGRGKMGRASQRALARGWKREKIQEPKLDISSAVNRRLNKALAAEDTLKLHDEKFTLALANRIAKQAFRHGVEIRQ